MARDGKMSQNLEGKTDKLQQQLLLYPHKITEIGNISKPKFFFFTAFYLGLHKINYSTLLLQVNCYVLGQGVKVIIR
jgi:hypothetical protein